MVRSRSMIALTALLLAAGPALADGKFNEVVKKTQARIEPIKVRRGQAVTWTFTTEVVDGWHTYPTKQADPNAEPFTNRFKFVNPAGAVFVGDLIEPAGIEKDEEGIKVVMVEGTGVWKRTLVIRPDAKPGTIKVPVRVTMMVCAKVCLPPQTINTEVELTITDEPPVEVDAKYRKELEAARK